MIEYARVAASFVATGDTFMSNSPSTGSDPIYLVRDGSNDAAARLEPTAYETEDEFQSLLARFPELLAGEQIDRSTPRRWLLVAREIGVPDGASGTVRWDLDHLFVDQDGIPTLVEVKRQSDTRLRREVIGQVLEYAANAARWWPAAYLAERFAATCTEDGQNPEAKLAEFLRDTSVDPAVFWKRVEDRLQVGDMRLIFFADRIPSELLRIVEFLNSQMTKTEVLAIEVQRYSGNGFSTHVPRLLGQTTEAQRVKEGVRATTQRRPWNESSFFAELAAAAPDAVDPARELLQLRDDPAFDLRYGVGSTVGSLNVYKPATGPHCMVSLLSSGKLTFTIGFLSAPSEQDARERLGDFLARSLGFVRSKDWPKQYPSYAPERWTAHVGALKQVLKSL